MLTEMAAMTELKNSYIPSANYQDEKVEEALYAIAQEAVNNALKHAEARTIAVELGETAADIYLIITDDGNGFKVADAAKASARRGSLGMVNLQERAALIGGEFRLVSKPGWGTQVTARVPKAEEERQKKRETAGPLSLW